MKIIYTKDYYGWEEDKYVTLDRLRVWKEAYDLLSTNLVGTILETNEYSVIAYAIESFAYTLSNDNPDKQKWIDRIKKWMDTQPRANIFIVVSNDWQPPENT